MPAVPALIHFAMDGLRHLLSKDGYASWHRTKGMTETTRRCFALTVRESRSSESLIAQRSSAEQADIASPLFQLSGAVTHSHLKSDLIFESATLATGAWRRQTAANEQHTTHNRHELYLRGTVRGASKRRTTTQIRLSSSARALVKLTTDKETTGGQRGSIRLFTGCVTVVTVVTGAVAPVNHPTHGNSSRKPDVSCQSINRSMTILLTSGRSICVTACTFTLTVD
ncbi:unnamed protein product [Soboliphyme baturini]|uniref:Uncharacterized protein n=1 Tax=Soboliphyme baturini TaxID=241478 RepID=A0A183IXX8_9BILA|nr:unnamed protein product [Soboliphyme baturini]